MGTMSRSAAATAAALLSLSLVGCGSNSSSGDSTDSSGKTPEAGAQETTGTGGSNMGSGGTIPDGYTATEIPELGMTIAVPSTWQIVDSSVLEDSEELEAAAEMLGQSTDAVAAALASTPLIAADPAPTTAFAENLNVINTHGKVKPTAAQMAADLEAGGATVNTYTEVKTASGDGATQSYTLDMGGTTIEGTAMLVPAPDGTFASITVLTESTQRTDEIVQAILASLS